MTICTAKCQKWTVFSFGTFFVVIGVLLAFFLGMIVNAVKDQQLSLSSKNTVLYGMWEVTPIPIYMGFHLFNWTNSEEVIKSNWTIKPNLEDAGPYTFTEKHYRKEVIFNDNYTITYKNQRIWHWVPERSNGSLSDLITTINPLPAIIVHIVQKKHVIVKMGVNFLLKKTNTPLAVTKSVIEFLFDGYDDTLLDLVHKLNFTKLKIPFKKFGWFSERNESIEADGVFNMQDGTNNIRNLGILDAWNYKEETGYYAGECGKIEGTTGELWYPLEDDSTVQVFTPDMCSTLTLKRTTDQTFYGIEGHRFFGDDSLFDNGTKYPKSSCFSPGEVMPSGVRNVSECKYNAPAFVSYPHFHLADPYYRESFEGLEPDPDKHGIFINLEPTTGIPLQADVKAQLNLRVQTLDRLELYKNVKDMLFPLLWFRQSVELTSGYAALVTLLVSGAGIGEDVGYAFLAVGIVLMAYFGYVLYKEHKAKTMIF